MTDIEYILDFATKLGGRMLICGANLERVDDTMYRVCVSYELTDISIFSLSKLIMISAKTEEGDYASRQIDVSAMDIHLEKLNHLNQLSRTVCSTTPDPKTLRGMLDEAEAVDDYPPAVMVIGKMIALSSLCVLFGGTLKDVIASDLISLVLIWMINFLFAKNLSNVMVNMLTMIFAAVAAVFLTNIGLGDQYFIIIINCSMLLVPGIPLVNAARNLLCGNEMNGILEGIKALVETLAIALGLIAGIYFFRGMI